MIQPQTLTLVAPTGNLSAGLWERAASLVASHARSAAAPVWLAPGTALDWAVTDTDWPGLSTALDALQIDCALHQPGERRRKRVLIADMDSTMVQGETLDELAAEAGIKDRIAAITARAMAGELDFADALRERVAALAGLPEAALARTLARTLLMPGAEALVATMAGNGAKCWLVSGGFTAFTGPIAERLGFEHQQGNSLEVVGGEITGKVLPPILDRDAKRSALERAAAERGASLADALAVGDGANDLAMIQAAGMGVAFQAKPAVRQAARFHVNHTDLRTLLYYQGYRAAEIIPHRR
jgi:phosphoserine phosphatase